MENYYGKQLKMQLDVDIEPTQRFPHMTSIDKQMDKIWIFAELEVFNQFAFLPQTDRQTEGDAYDPTVQLAQVGSIKYSGYREFLELNPTQAA